MIGYRAATAADVGAVVALVESAYRGDSSRAGWTTEADLLGGQRTDADAVRAIVDAADAEVLLAEDATGSIVGCCQLEWRSCGICYFGLFAVSPQRQASGIGRQLLEAAERRAVERGAGTMEMTVIAQRGDLIGWYERRGYARTGESRPFPYGDERYGLPRREDLHFVVLAKPLVQE
ncbi:MAG TPA: GNAT family N-acetyltransferase [Mycobacteriales bacterium]|nr:GNAT family N-acetyltransferase [Mycobacteriales bacterium]